MISPAIDLASQNQASIQRLRWQCRRGLLELDYILENYLSTRYASASCQEQAQFVQLLKQQDTDIQSWLFGGQEPAREFALIVSRLRTTI